MFQVDLSRGSQNPMDSVSFFDYADSVEKKKMPADQIGTMFPICNVVSASLLLMSLHFLIRC